MGIQPKGAIDFMYEDYLGRKYVTLGTSDNDAGLYRLATRVCLLCWPEANLAEHFDDVRVIAGYKSQIVILESIWMDFSSEKQARINDYVTGFIDGIESNE